MGGLAVLDWLVMALYGAAVLGIGWWANRRQQDTEDYFLGGRRLRWWVVGISLIATSFSAVSLIGGTGFGFGRGLAWLQLQIGDLIAIVAVCLVFLPFFSSLGLTTAYEYLERRFGAASRTVASSLFLLQTLLRTAVLVYAPALALSTILGWSVEVAILVTAAAAIVYSAFGGIAAVVWTDCIQLGVVLLGVGYCLHLAAGQVPGGFGALVGHANDAGRLEAVTLDDDPGNLFSVLGACVPYAVFAFSLFGTGQQAVQRFLSCADLRSARRAALLGWGVGTLALGATLLLGALLAGWVDLGPSADTARFAGVKGDDVLPTFIAHQLPAGWAGLLLAAIFAASMSSLDSAIHSMSTAAIVDFRRRFWPATAASPRRELAIARGGTVVFGLLATAGALYAAESETGILETLVTWLGYVAGPLLGLFLLGIFSVRANETGALTGVSLALLGVFATVALVGSRPLGFHPLWLAPASCVVTLGLGWLTSLAAPPPDEAQLTSLTWRRRA